jgi:hypothetical protein
MTTSDTIEMPECHQRAGYPSSYVRWWRWGAPMDAGVVTDMASFSRTWPEAANAYREVVDAYLAASLNDGEDLFIRRQLVARLNG